MSSYSGIYDVSSAVQKLLREHLVPDVIERPEGILLCSPSERGDAEVAVYLYDIHAEEIQYGRQPLDAGSNVLLEPSAYFKLHYMITAFSKAEVKERTSDEMKILGKIIQVFQDNSIMHPETYLFQREMGNGISIVMERMTDDAKYRIAGLPGMVQKPSLFYSAAPCEIRSGRREAVSRVKEFGTMQYEK